MNLMRWRYGDTNPVLMPAREDIAYEIGDLIYRDIYGYALPAESMDRDEPDLFGDFHRVFVGVAMQASPVGDDRSIRVATTGVFEFDWAVGTSEVGDLVGPAVLEGSLLNQFVAKASEASKSIGLCAKQVATPATRLLVEIRSPLMRALSAT